MPAPAGQSDSRPRRRIGRYLVTARIGRGGMGMVYRGLDESLEREVAIKTLTAEGSFDEESRKRFEIEARAAAKLQHANILTVFELGEDRGVPFIAMELLPGADLEALMRQPDQLLLLEKLEIVLQVCRGLAYAHEHKIVHRDIKPSNIRVLDDGSAKIMDFGIAKLQGTGVTKAGMMVGTVHYMSPEQIRGKVLDGRSDVFSVGVILYELLAGQRPFPGTTATEVLYKIVHDPPAPLRLPEDFGPAGPGLQQVVDRALAKDPSQRFGSATEMADALAATVASLKAAAGSAASPDLEVVQSARRLVKEGRLEESLHRLKEVVERHPGALDARRALRAVTRELTLQQRARPAEDDFPELASTFQAPPTRLAPGTATVLSAPGQDEPAHAAEAAPAPPQPAAPSSRALVLAAGATLVAAVVVGALLVSGPGRDRTAGNALEAGAVRIPVRSQPPGAEVLVDGKLAGFLTDGELALPGSRRGQVLLTFRKAGYRDESRTLALPLPAGESVSVTLGVASRRVSVVSDPAGAAVALDGVRTASVTPAELTLDPGSEHRVTISLEGYAPRELRVPAGQPPAELRAILEPSGPLGRLTLTSAYPLDVTWKGKLIAKGQLSPKLQLPQGRQSLTLASAAVFLRTSLTVDVQAETSLPAPGLGRLSIRAVPDNCEVFIDGLSAGYLPILDKPVSTGTHTVLFRWPDGARHEESVDVSGSRPAYVTGRRQ